jgi:hypothetical protein
MQQQKLFLRGRLPFLFAASHMDAPESEVARPAEKGENCKEKRHEKL